MFTTGPAFFANLVQNPLPLDGFTTGLWGAYGIAKLLTAYSGNCLRVRRSSDNTEQDIGFTGNSLDTASLSTFVGSNSAFVSKWYDQSGGARSAVNATAASQPIIVNSGAYQGKLVFDGVDDCLVTPNSSSSLLVVTPFIAGKLRSLPNTYNQFLEFGVPNWTNSGAAFYVDSSMSNMMICSVGVTNSFFSFNASTLPNNDIQAYVVNRPAAGAAAVTRYINGTPITSASPTGGPLSGNFATQTWSIGARYNGTNAAAFDCRACIIYESGVSSGNISTISSRLLAAGF